MGGNPLRCGCSALWLGAWLRRWAREAGRGSAAARGESCVAGGEARVALVAQGADEAECHASALSSRGARGAAGAGSPLALVCALAATLGRS